MAYEKSALTPAGKTALEFVDRALAGGDRALAEILSALRGDDGDQSRKATSTAVLRSVALPHLHASQRPVGYHTANPNQPIEIPRRGSRHANDHLRLAALALGHPYVER